MLFRSSINIHCTYKHNKERFLTWYQSTLATLEGRIAAVDTNVERRVKIKQMEEAERPRRYVSTAVIRLYTSRENSGINALTNKPWKKQTGKPFLFPRA